jgi:hypothetical protein
MKTIITALALLGTGSFSQAQNNLLSENTQLHAPDIILKQDSISIILEDTIPKKPEESRNAHTALQSSKVLERADSSFMRGQKDAKKYYVGYNKAANTVFVVSILSPLFGLASAVVFSNIPPTQQNLGYPNEALFSNKQYQNGYKYKAKQIKIKKVWTNFGAVLAIDLGVLLVVAYAMTH